RTRRRVGVADGSGDHDRGEDLLVDPLRARVVDLQDRALDAGRPRGRLDLDGHRLVQRQLHVVVAEDPEGATGVVLEVQLVSYGLGRAGGTGDGDVVRLLLAGLQAALAVVQAGAVARGLQRLVERGVDGSIDGVLVGVGVVADRV